MRKSTALCIDLLSHSFGTATVVSEDTVVVPCSICCSSMLERLASRSLSAPVGLFKGLLPWDLASPPAAKLSCCQLLHKGFWEVAMFCINDIRVAIWASILAIASAVDSSRVDLYNGFWISDMSMAALDSAGSDISSDCCCSLSLASDFVRVICQYRCDLVTNLCIELLLINL